MYDNKNNKNNSQSNQIDVIQDVTTRCSRGKKVEKLQPKLYKEDLGFTQLLNETLNAIDDAEMLGVYCYLASKPEEWEISKQQLRNHFKIGVNKIDNIFTKLKSLGLLETLPLKNKQGQIIHWDYYLKMRISIPMETIPMETMPLENTPPINKEYINKEKEIYRQKQPQANKSPIIQFLFSNNPFNFDEETLKGYLEMRKSIKKPLTEKAWILLIKEIQKAVDQGMDPSDCINEAILRSWQGFKCEWLQRHSEAKIMQPRAPETIYNRKETASTVPFYNSTEKNDKPRTEEQVKSALQATKSMLNKLKKNVP